MIVVIFIGCFFKAHNHQLLAQNLNNNAPSHYVPGSYPPRWFILFADHFKYPEKAAHFKVNSYVKVYVEVDESGKIRKSKAIALKNRPLFIDSRYTINAVNFEEFPDVRKIIRSNNIKSEVPETMIIKLILDEVEKGLIFVAPFTPATLGGKPHKTYYILTLDFNFW